MSQYRCHTMSLEGEGSLAKIAQIGQKHRGHFPLLEDSPPKLRPVGNRTLKLDKIVPSIDDSLKNVSRLINGFQQSIRYRLGVRCSALFAISRD